jgi:signal transduction histidine kinase
VLIATQDRGLKERMTIRMQLTLARKIWLGLTGVLLLALVSGGAGLAFALRSERAYKDLLTRNLDQAGVIDGLTIALLDQGNLSTSYILDGSQRWLDGLTEGTWRFEHCLQEAARVGFEPDQSALIDQIRDAFRQYSDKRDQAVRLCAAGDSEQASRVLLQEAGPRYDRVRRLCQSLGALNNLDIEAAMTARHLEAWRAGLWVGLCLLLLTGLVAGLAWLFLGGVFRPLRQITEDMRDYLRPGQAQEGQNEVQALGSCLRTLKSDVAVVRSSLDQSNRRLLEAEKLAMVGRLAAGVAHEIRSPLTSLNLRLFSMQKLLRDDPRLQHDIRVLSEEVSRLDNIIRNFLEFSRPPELRVQRCDTSLLLDKTLELMRYEFSTGNIRLTRSEMPDPPALLVDPHQLRQVLINLINNAIEAQPKGGSIHLTVTAEPDDRNQIMLVIRVRDAGGGIPDAIASRVFDPFFTTKSDGAGLGLWNAQRIVSQHGGMLEIEESTDQGTVFAVWIPAAQGVEDEQDTGRGRRSGCAGRV